jgi:adenine-specific DNA-methyltransferase
MICLFDIISTLFVMGQAFTGHTNSLMPSLSWLHKQHAEQAAGKVPHHLLTVQSVHGDSTSGNLLIQGDNLKALKALLPTYRGRVKCIFIDPPYNTQSAFAHYNDKLEHSLWLTMMLPRLQLLRELLSEDGSIWVTIDDNEGHYLKVLMDEVFGRGNFVGDMCVGRIKIFATSHNDAQTDFGYDPRPRFGLLESQQGWPYQRNLLTQWNRRAIWPLSELRTTILRGPWHSTGLHLPNSPPMSAREPLMYDQ